MESNLSELLEKVETYLRPQLNYPVWAVLNTKLKLALLAGAKMDVAVLLDHCDEINSGASPLTWAIAEQALFLAVRLGKGKTPEREVVKESIEGIGSRTFQPDTDVHLNGYAPRALRLLEQYRNEMRGHASISLTRG